jgi:antitoxin component YwqK of YwqJK toxin-antitoxin module
MNIEKSFIKNTLFILFTLFFLCSCASRKIEEDLICIQIDDRNGLSETISSKKRLQNYQEVDFLSSQPYNQVTRIYKKGASDKKISKITSYHENGEISQYLEVVNARAFGKYKKWHFNGNLAIDAKVIGGPPSFSYSEPKKWIFDGLCKAFDENGNLISTFTYNKGNLEGKTFYYYPSGKVKKIEPYLKNRIEGVVLEYDEEGNVTANTNYLNGLKHGEAKVFLKDNYSFFEKYKEGLLLEAEYLDRYGKGVSKILDGNGEKAFFENGSLKKLVEYKEGKIEGKTKVFENGKLLRGYGMKKGKKHGEEVEYYPLKNENVKKMSINWVDGVIQGSVKTWYPNSKLQSQREIFQNKKNGIASAFYKNGEVMLIEEYESDRLIEGSYYKKGDNYPVSKVLDGNGKATIYDEDGIFLKSIKYVKGVPRE